MKKILFLLLTLTLCVALFACGGDTPCTEHVDADGNGKCDACDATVEPEGGDEGGTGTGEDLILVSDYKTGFGVVCADSLSAKSTEYVLSFIKDLNRYYLDDQALKQNYDAPGFDEVVEIIFGSPIYRGDEFIKDEHYLGYKGFSIEVIGNKLFVLAGGDKGYQEAIKYLEETLFDLDSYGEDVIDDLVIPAGTKHEHFANDYSITEFTVGGTNISEFVIAYNNSTKDAKTAATTLRNTIYKDAGIWLDYVPLSDVTADQKVI